MKTVTMIEFHTGGGRPRLNIITNVFLRNILYGYLASVRLFHCRF